MALGIDLGDKRDHDQRDGRVEVPLQPLLPYYRGHLVREEGQDQRRRSLRVDRAAPAGRGDEDPAGQIQQLRAAKRSDDAGFLRGSRRIEGMWDDRLGGEYTVAMLASFEMTTTMQRDERLSFPVCQGHA